MCAFQGTEQKLPLVAGHFKSMGTKRAGRHEWRFRGNDSRFDLFLRNDAFQLGHREAGMIRKHHRLLQHVLQFAHVAAPGTATQALDGLRGQLPVRQSGTLPDLFENVFAQDFQVAQTLAQRWHADRQDIQAIEQIVTEQALGDAPLQIDAGCGNDPHIGLDYAVRTDRLELLFLQHAQELGLQYQRHFTDFVEEQRPPLGQFELAIPRIAVRSGIGSRNDAKKLGFEQVVGNRCNIDVHKGFVATQRRGMDGVRQQLLAGAGFTQQQHRRFTLRRTARLALELHAHRTGADEIGKGVFRTPFLGQPLLRHHDIALHRLEAGKQGFQ